MRMSRFAPVVLVMTACASSQPEAVVTPQPTPQPMVAKALDPVGSYEVVTTVDGQSVTGTMTITGTPGTYTGKILTNLFPEIPVIGALVEGQGMIVRANMPDGVLTLNLKFSGVSFMGNWELGGQGDAVSGKKLP